MAGDIVELRRFPGLDNGRRHPRVADRVAGLILAAGRSSRMGVAKPLLPLGSMTVLENAITRVREGGVDEITVVVGWRGDEIGAVAARAGARVVVNADFDGGMFTSVVAGIRSVAPGCAGCLLLPVDVPLVRPSTIRAVLGAVPDRRSALIYPMFQGRRGHPPFLSRDLFAEILSHDGSGGLRTVLARHKGGADTVLVDDEGILRDMDTPEDYRAMRRLVRLGAV